MNNPAASYEASNTCKSLSFWLVQNLSLRFLTNRKDSRQAGMTNMERRLTPMQNIEEFFRLKRNLDETPNNNLIIGCT